MDKGEIQPKPLAPRSRLAPLAPAPQFDGLSANQNTRCNFCVKESVNKFRNLSLTVGGWGSRALNLGWSLNSHAYIVFLGNFEFEQCIFQFLWRKTWLLSSTNLTYLAIAILGIASQFGRRPNKTICCRCWAIISAFFPVLVLVKRWWHWQWSLLFFKWVSIILDRSLYYT